MPLCSIPQLWSCTWRSMNGGERQVCHKHTGNMAPATFSEKLNLFPLQRSNTKLYITEVWYTNCLGEKKPPRNNLTPSSRADYKHEQVIQKVIYPRTSSALVLLSLSSPPPSHASLISVSAHPNSLLLYSSSSLPCLSFCPDCPTTQVIRGLTVKSWC